jgi:hypothetical protein
VAGVAVSLDLRSGCGVTNLRATNDLCWRPEAVVRAMRGIVRQVRAAAGFARRVSSEIAQKADCDHRSTAAHMALTPKSASGNPTFGNAILHSETVGLSPKA